MVINNNDSVEVGGYAITYRGGNFIAVKIIEIVTAITQNHQRVTTVLVQSFRVGSNKKPYDMPSLVPAQEYHVISHSVQSHPISLAEITLTFNCDRTSSVVSMFSTIAPSIIAKLQAAKPTIKNGNVFLTWLQSSTQAIELI